MKKLSLAVVLLTACMLIGLVGCVVPDTNGGNGGTTPPNSTEWKNFYSGIDDLKGKTYKMTVRRDSSDIDGYKYDEYIAFEISGMNVNFQTVVDLSGEADPSSLALSKGYSYDSSKNQALYVSSKTASEFSNRPYAYSSDKKWVKYETGTETIY